MKAPWKQTPLQQAQKRSPALDKEKQIAELKHKIKVLQEQLRESRYKVASLNDACTLWRENATNLQRHYDRYNTLRTLDVMIMDKDGAKYLKGEELDKYIDAHHAVDLQAAIHQRLSKHYQQALAASMVQTKQAVANSILKPQYIYQTYPTGFTITEGWDDGDDTGGQGQEANQGNP